MGHVPNVDVKLNVINMKLKISDKILVIVVRKCVLHTLNALIAGTITFG